MKLLGLDLATKTGFAHTAGMSGTWDFTVKKDESSGMRLVRFRGKLEEIYKNCGVDIVFYEGAVQFAGSRAGAAVQSEMQGVLKLWCEEKGIEYKSFAPTQVKKHATGKGNAKKPQMIDAAEKKFKRIFQDSDDNEVDALWILDLAKKEYSLVQETDS